MWHSLGLERPSLFRWPIGVLIFGVDDTSLPTVGRWAESILAPRGRWDRLTLLTQTPLSEISKASLAGWEIRPDVHPIESASSSNASAESTQSLPHALSGITLSNWLQANPWPAAVVADARFLPSPDKWVGLMSSLEWADLVLPHPHPARPLAPGSWWSDFWHRLWWAPVMPDPFLGVLAMRSAVGRQLALQCSGPALWLEVTQKINYHPALIAPLDWPLDESSSVPPRPHFGQLADELRPVWKDPKFRKTETDTATPTSKIKPLPSLQEDWPAPPGPRPRPAAVASNGSMTSSTSFGPFSGWSTARSLG